MDSEYKLFYRTDEWRAIRNKAANTYGKICMKCGSRKHIHVDHIFPRSKYIHLELDFSNLQILCRGCNEEKSNIDYTDYRSDDQVKLGNLIAGKISAPKKKKQRPPKRVRVIKNIHSEIDEYAKHLCDLGRGRYRFRDQFDICTNSMKIMFINSSAKSVSYRSGLIRCFIARCSQKETA